jgi:hypothetical protein
MCPLFLCSSNSCKLLVSFQSSEKLVLINFPSCLLSLIAEETFRSPYLLFSVTSLGELNYIFYLSFFLLCWGLKPSASCKCSITSIPYFI